LGLRFFSTKNRAPHLGPYPLERLRRLAEQPDLSTVPPAQALDFRKLDTPHSLVNAMGEYQAMMDVIRDGLVNPSLAAAPEDRIDEIMAGLKESLERAPSSIDEHTHAIVILDEHLRTPKTGEPGTEWIIDAQGSHGNVIGC